MRTDKKILLPLRLKNHVKQYDENYEFFIHTIEVNGIKKGCSGFIRNPNTKVCVYVNTEPPAYGGLAPLMYRYADTINDYTGYRNRWANSENELVRNIVKLLQSSPEAEHDIRV